MKLTIPAVPPSLNKTLGMNRWERQALNESWRLLIRTQFLPDGRGREKKRVRIVLWHSRRYDECDNLQGSCKPIFDALKSWGLIYDDSPEWLEAHISQEKCKHRDRHTTIEIEPAGA